MTIKLLCQLRMIRNIWANHETNVNDRARKLEALGVFDEYIEEVKQALLENDHDLSTEKKLTKKDLYDLMG